MPWQILIVCIYERKQNGSLLGINSNDLTSVGTVHGLGKEHWNRRGYLMHRCQCICKLKKSQMQNGNNPLAARSFFFFFVRPPNGICTMNKWTNEQMGWLMPHKIHIFGALVFKFVTMHFAAVAKYSVGVLPIKSRLLFWLFRIECVSVSVYLHLLSYCFLFISFGLESVVRRAFVDLALEYDKQIDKHRMLSKDKKMNKKKFTLVISIHIIISKNERH